MPHTLDAVLLRRWAGMAIDALDGRREEIDRINVFPVPDRDTGTNLLLTMRAAAEAAARSDGEVAGELQAAHVASAMATGALVGARGNSGVILSQVLRALADTLTSGPTAGSLDGAGHARSGADGASGDGANVLRATLVRAAELATAAVAVPREGTVLSVLAAAAAGATECRADRLFEVAGAAAAAAASALEKTTMQLAELARAGVVDAGGLGLVVVLDALVAAISGDAVDVRAMPGIRAAAGSRPVRDRDALVGEREGGSVEFDYEVMYLLDGATEQRVAALRAELASVGDSVAVVGDGAGLWNVHVHCTDVGAAVEAGIAAGRPHRITVVRFADQLAEQAAATERAAAAAGRFTRARGVLTVLTAEPVAVLARGEGATVLVAEYPYRPDEVELAAALAGTRARHVVLLPNDPELTSVAERAASIARQDGQDVVVVPTSSPAQGLAALAVHDPTRRPGDDVVAMAEAAAATRTGGIQVAESEALTWAGRCRPGDVLGLADGEVVLIAADLTDAACTLVDRMLTVGGELVTVLLGADADDALAGRIEEHVAANHPVVDVVFYRGGQFDYVLLLGVE